MKRKGKKKPIGATKGSTNERKLCKEISLWWSDGKDPNIFCRTNEGSQAPEEQGDMKARKSEGFPLMKMFCFEFKHYRNVDLLELLDDRKEKLLLKWWNQVNENSKSSESTKSPFLLFKRNNRKPYVALDNATVGILEEYGGLFPNDKLIEYTDIVIMRWDTFKDKVRKDDIIAIGEN